MYESSGMRVGCEHALIALYCGVWGKASPSESSMYAEGAGLWRFERLDQYGDRTCIRCIRR